MIKRLVSVAVVMLATAPGVMAEGPRAFIGGRIIPIGAPEIGDGVLVIDGGRIVAVGPRGAVEIPAEAERVDVRGKTIMPGLVDTHNHIGGIGGGDGSGPIQPEVRVSDSLNPLDAGYRRAVAGGLTTLNVMPGSGHLCSGQTVYLKLRGGKTVEEMMIRDADGRPTGGLKMANGTNPQRDPPFPGTRGKAAALVREQFIKAQAYREKLRAAADDPEKRPERDLAMETLVEVLDGKRVVHHHTHRADDIMTVLRLSKEFGFRVVLHHVSEGWKVADEVAAAGVPCSVILVDSPGGKLEAVNLVMKTPGVMARAGVRVALHTDDWITDSRLFLRMAALAVRAGMSREQALESVTLAGAEILDLQDRIGSLAPGKDADFVILDGDPLSVYTKVLETWVEGAKVFDRSVPEDYLHAVGGYGAGNDQVPYFCCFDHGQGE